MDEDIPEWVSTELEELDPQEHLALFARWLAEERGHWGRQLRRLVEGDWKSSQEYQEFLKAWPMADHERWLLMASEELEVMDQDEHRAMYEAWLRENGYSEEEIEGIFAEEEWYRLHAHEAHVDFATTHYVPQRALELEAREALQEMDTYLSDDDDDT